MDLDGVPGVNSDPDREYPCLIRVKCGKKKLSSVVKPQDYEKFCERYGAVVRFNMDSMKKKEKDKDKKQNRAAKKQKAGSADTSASAKPSVK
ncbi:hypothetical protein HDU93_003724 [Gonapodya sp. JEL0774]|nr:hypothetical protein HDU93_003724 [Gonapodya sp. JEL0774]